MDHSKYSKTETEDEEEALSLCDLPISTTHHNRPEPVRTGSGTYQTDNFDFKFSFGNIPREPEICAAEDVFFQGRILPYRHSISSDTGISMVRTGSCDSNRYVSRSESMDHFQSRGVISSRSSSINSQYSSSSGSGSITGTNQKVRNYFHSHPSPSPQIRYTGSRYGNFGNYSRKSNTWSFFRVGLVQTPGIELQDLKNRPIDKNRNKNFGSRNSSSSKGSSRNGSKIVDDNISCEKKKKKKSLFDLGNCKCSINVINPVPITKVVNFGDEESKGKMKRERTTSSRYRTFEWLKELSVANVPCEE